MDDATKPSYDEILTRLTLADQRLDRDLVHKWEGTGALCKKTPGYMSSIRLTKLDTEVICKECFDILLERSKTEIEQLRRALERIVSLDGCACYPKCEPSHVDEAIDIARAALGERSTSPEPRPYVPASLDKCVCGRVYAEHVIYTGTDDIFCPAQFIGTMDKFRVVSTSEGEGS